MYVCGLTIYYIHIGNTCSAVARYYSSLSYWFWNSYDVIIILKTLNNFLLQVRIFIMRLSVMWFPVCSRKRSCSHLDLWYDDLPRPGFVTTFWVNLGGLVLERWEVDRPTTTEWFLTLVDGWPMIEVATTQGDKCFWINLEHRKCLWRSGIFSLYFKGTRLAPTSMDYNLPSRLWQGSVQI